MFHGNGGNAGHRIPLAKVLYMRIRCNVLMLSYRVCVVILSLRFPDQKLINVASSYGHSEGSPSEKGAFSVIAFPWNNAHDLFLYSKGIRMDAQAALDFVTSHPALSSTPVVRRNTIKHAISSNIFQIIYGQSIGGAVSIDLASRNPTKVSSRSHFCRQTLTHLGQIRALILENTFLSLPRLIPTAMPWLAPVSFLCHQKWDSASKIPLLPSTMPVLMLSGKRDQIVPKEHMQELESLLRPKDGEGAKRKGSFIEFAWGSHSTFSYFVVL